VYLFGRRDRRLDHNFNVVNVPEGGDFFIGLLTSIGAEQTGLVSDGGRSTIAVGEHA